MVLFSHATMTVLFPTLTMMVLFSHATMTVLFPHAHDDGALFQ
jgi:hypothetical protein